MRLFCSTAITGEDTAEVTRRMQLVTEALDAAGHDTYCQSLDLHVAELRKQGVKAVMYYAFEKLAQYDGVVVIVTSDRKSEGMLMEVGVALAANKPIYLFWHGSAHAESSHLPSIATEMFQWHTESDLQKTLAKL